MSSAVARRRASRTFVLLLSFAVVACATGVRDARKKDKPEGKPKQKTEAVRVDTLGAAVRALGEHGANIVVMHGLEERKIDPNLYAKLDADNAAGRLAEAAQCDIQESGPYAFLYLNQAPYDALAGINIGEKLDTSYRDTKATIALGAGTKLFTALAMLSHALNRTLVADNTIAETPCGELSLNDAPLANVLEGILKSSRLVGVSLDSTEEYIFISGKPAPKRTALLNAGKLNEKQRAFLDSRVSVHLPVDSKEPKRLTLDTGAEILKLAAPDLGRQLGAPVQVAPDLVVLPVNPVVMRNVRVQTALDLIVRQWPIQQFGYEIAGDRILIRRRTAADAPPAS